ncbi:hypothetical protein [Nonomuraea sp. NPDC049141]|uniref:hypothetical protein n=1 Tax=Nonomuraea sp. NPDC049141 TaxID=3155500 RepID=UPI0033FE910C
MNTATLYEALERHYRKPGTDSDGEILLAEVEAPSSTKRADMIRIGAWQSRGYSIDVHELKVSRQDWLNELNNPAKAEAWWPYCTRFWIVAPPKMIQPEEMPSGWGLMVPPNGAGRRRFNVVVPAAVKEPKLTLELVSALARRTDYVRLAEMDRLREQHRDELCKRLTEARQNAARSGLPEAMRRRVALLEEVEKLLGAKLDQFAWGDGTRLDRMSPHELATALADCGEHIRLQQLRALVEELMGRLSYTAQMVMTEMRKVGDGT